MPIGQLGHGCNLHVYACLLKE